MRENVELPTQTTLPIPLALDVTPWEALACAFWVEVESSEEPLLEKPEDDSEAHVEPTRVYPEAQPEQEAAEAQEEHPAGQSKGNYLWEKIKSQQQLPVQSVLEEKVWEGQELTHPEL